MAEADDMCDDHARLLYTLLCCQTYVGGYHGANGLYLPFEPRCLYISFSCFISFSILFTAENFNEPHYTPSPQILSNHGLGRE
jgi:hypothetical protein